MANNTGINTFREEKEDDDNIEYQNEDKDIIGISPISENDEPYQKIYSNQSEISYKTGEDINFDITYTNSELVDNLTGVAFRVHYNSAVIRPTGENSGINERIDTFNDPRISDDVDDLDNDSSTDKYIDLTYLDFYGNFPDEPLPAKLADITFTPIQEDPVTGVTLVNFTPNQIASNYDFVGESVALKSEDFKFNLDVDGDGRITALGDGLMVIRKLFGESFAGDALTDKAISRNATRTTEEIHEYIQSGIYSKDLDVDGDGEVRPFSDGLMVIRKLFGPSYEGEDLTFKAISPDATRTTDEVHDYIESLMVLDPIA